MQIGALSITRKKTPELYCDGTHEHRVYSALKRSVLKDYDSICFKCFLAAQSHLQTALMPCFLHLNHHNREKPDIHMWGSVFIFIIYSRHLL